MWIIILVMIIVKDITKLIVYKVCGLLCLVCVASKQCFAQVMDVIQEKSGEQSLESRIDRRMMVCLCRWQGALGCSSCSTQAYLTIPEQNLAPDLRYFSLPVRNTLAPSLYSTI